MVVNIFLRPACLQINPAAMAITRELRQAVFLAMLKKPQPTRDIFKKVKKLMPRATFREVSKAHPTLPLIVSHTAQSAWLYGL